jgi:hypothetical protein
MYRYVDLRRSTSSGKTQAQISRKISSTTAVAPQPFTKMAAPPETESVVTEEEDEEIEEEERQQELPTLKLELGANVLVYGKHRGHIAYMGKLHYTKNELIGVVLDEPRGKNNGTLKGVQYFECSPQHGLMVSRDDIHLL